MEVSRREPLISFNLDVSVGDLVGFNAITILEKNNLSPNPVDTLSSDNFFLKTDIFHGMILKGLRLGTINIFTMDLDPGYKYNESFRGCVQRYMMESEDFISNINFI